MDIGLLNMLIKSLTCFSFGNTGGINIMLWIVLKRQ